MVEFSRFLVAIIHAARRIEKTPRPLNYIMAASFKDPAGSSRDGSCFNISFMNYSSSTHLGSKAFGGQAESARVRLGGGKKESTSKSDALRANRTGRLKTGPPRAARSTGFQKRTRGYTFMTALNLTGCFESPVSTPSSPSITVKMVFKG